MRYWITHPNLTPDHDQEIEAGALADWSRSGWRIRDDQTPRVVEPPPADPREPTTDQHDPLTSSDIPAPAATTKKKGEV